MKLLVSCSLIIIPLHLQASNSHKFCKHICRTHIKIVLKLWIKERSLPQSKMPFSKAMVSDLLDFMYCLIVWIFFIKKFRNIQTHWIDYFHPLWFILIHLDIIYPWIIPIPYWLCPFLELSFIHGSLNHVRLVGNFMRFLQFKEPWKVA
jgi:hypothetical protein